MNNLPSDSTNPIGSAGGALVACLACIASFIPPLSDHLPRAELFHVAMALGIAVSLVLHLVFVGMAAKQLGRRPVPWVLGALFSFPIGSIVALLLIESRRGEGAGARARG